MEVLMKIVVFCVLVCWVSAGHQYHDHHTSSTEKAHNRTNAKEEFERKLRDVIFYCIDETKADPDMVMQMRKGKWRQPLRKHPMSLKKWSLCLYVKLKMMSPDGVLRQEVVMSRVPVKDRAKVEQVIDKCLYKKRRSAADIAWHYLTCFRDKFSKYSII